MKKLPVEVDIPELVASLGLEPNAGELIKAVGDNSLLAYYYLLRIGEYTVKRARNNSKQPKQFKLEDATFFKKNKLGQLRQMAWDAPEEEIMTADSMTLKLDNQKNGWKAVCVHQEWNGDPYTTRSGQEDGGTATSGNIQRTGKPFSLPIGLMESATT